MNLSIFIESEPGHGQDTAISGQNYAFVFDGLGGKGGKPRTNAAGERKLEAKIASTVSAMALEKLLKDRMDWWSDNLIQNEYRRAHAPDEIAAEISRALNYALQDAAREWNADTLPTTISGWLVFPLPDETFYALAIWAGDSRCYTIDDHCMKLYTRDDTADNQRADAMEELLLSGSPAISNRLGVDRTVRLNHTTLIVDHPTLLLTCSDGIYGYVPSPMHLEYYLRNLGVEDSVEKMVAVWNKFFLDSGLLQDDSATLEGIYVGERPDDLDEFKEMLLAPLDELEEKYIQPFPQPPELKDSDELVRGIGIKLGKNDAFRAALSRNIRRYAEKGVSLPDGFPCAKFAAELREKQIERTRLEKRNLEKQCSQAEAELDELIDTVRYPKPVLEDVVDTRKKVLISNFTQRRPDILHDTVERMMNHLLSIYYTLIHRYGTELKKYGQLSCFNMGDNDTRLHVPNSYFPYTTPMINSMSFTYLYPELTEDGMRKRADDLENALFDIRVLADEILAPYYDNNKAKLVRAGDRELRIGEQELSPEQKKELKKWLIEDIGTGGMELKYCDGDLTLDLPALNRLLHAAQRYRDAVNAEEDGTVPQEEIDRYMEESAAADAKYLARKWFENGRVEGFELPTKLAASIQKHIDKAHEAKKTRLNAFEQYRLDRLELWKQYKPDFEAWSEEPEMAPEAVPETKPMRELVLSFLSKRKGKTGSESHETEAEPELVKEFLSVPKTSAEMGLKAPGSDVETSLTEPLEPKQPQEDAADSSVLTQEEKEPDLAVGDKKELDLVQPYIFEKFESERRN